MGHAELYVTWLLLLLIAFFAAVAAYGVSQLGRRVEAIERQLSGYRHSLD